MHESLKRLHKVMGTTSGKNIAIALDVNPSAVTNWKTRGVSKEGALAAAKLKGVDANYILHGENPPKPSIDELRAKIDRVENKVRDENGNKKEVVYAKAQPSDKVPVISWVAAGSWTEVDAVTLDDVIERIPKLDHLSDKQFGLIIQGRSMLPRFSPGDIIYVEPNITPWELKDGDLVVVQCNDGKEATFKQLVVGDTSDDMYLKPLNPDWHEQKLIPMGECVLVGIADRKIEKLR